MLKLGSMNVRSRIFWLLLVCFLASSMFVFQISRTAVQAIVEDFMYEYVKINQEKTESSLEFLFNQVHMLSVRLLTEDEIYDTAESGRQESEAARTKLAAILDTMAIDDEIVGEVVIATKDGRFYPYSGQSGVGLPDRSYLNEIERSQTPVWGEIRKDAGGEAYLQLGRKYQSFYTGQNIGYLVVYIRESAIRNVLKKVIVEDHGYSFLVADDEYVLSYPDDGKVGTTLFDKQMLAMKAGQSFKKAEFVGSPSIVAVYPLEGSFRNLGLDWKIVSIVSDEKLLANVNKIKQYSLLLQIAAIGLAVAISLYAAKGILRPIRRMNRRIVQFAGTADYVAPYRNPKDELRTLEDSFNDMVVRIRELIARNNEEKDRQREMELIALQAQINPHFLYNTLDAIGWLAKIHRQSEIEKMVIALAHFYRLSLHKGDRYIAVEEEIGIVKSYVAIEAQRFPQKFAVRYEIAEDILPLRLLKIIIQPLVENAIKHGVSRKRGSGNIVVKGYREGDQLLFEVSDDGAGFDVRELDDESRPARYKGGGYGIRSVNERIRLEYGAGYGVEIRSAPGSGTVSLVKVKAKCGEEERPRKAAAVI
ncbi:sensor histidine kinase [Cohnella massiliensis]|uniref:sensor histidine kinase n=1 Tax=Cohnella massiliensis TaxID=1816691 RepID=UPI0009BC6F92|nr:sensor histidine kinase [Cohnella massiliensis]